MGIILVLIFLRLLPKDLSSQWHLTILVGQISEKNIVTFECIWHKKGVSFDMIQPLPNAIINGFSKGIFLGDAKIAMISSSRYFRNNISNFQSVGILTVFSKIYEKVTKKLSDTAMKKYLSAFISAFRQDHSFQHVLITLLEEWREVFCDIYNRFL